MTNNKYRTLIDHTFGEYASRSINNLTAIQKVNARYLVAKGYAQYILNAQHVEFLKYPKRVKGIK